jgi:predicted O-methyltransferase YrrM
MYSTAELVINYLRFYWEASNSKGHGVHSPFVFDFINKVLRDKYLNSSLKQWNGWRQDLLRSREKIQLEEIGAGSRIGNFRISTIGALVKRTSKPVRTAHLLYRILNHYQPNSILELGTSVGLSASLFSLARPDASIHTIEGVSTIHAKAVEYLGKWNCKNIHCHLGNLDIVLPEVLKVMPAPDLVFMDGNHQEEPTIRYFNQILDYLPESAIVLVDDIHWSAGMERAWKQIQHHPRVTTTIDLFQLGLVFFRPSFRTKLHYKIRF